LVSKECHQFATDLLIDGYIASLNEALESINQKISEAWGGQVSEQRGKELTKLFSDLSRLGEELQMLRKSIQAKKDARNTIFRMNNVDWTTKAQLLKACSFDSELLNLRTIAESIKKGKEDFTQGRSPLDRFRDWDVDDPLRIGPPRGPPGWPGPMPPGGIAPPGYFGEPDADHFRPPDWERDRNPPMMPGMPRGSDPFAPFGGGFGSGPNPFNPRGGGGRGPRFL